VLGAVTVVWSCALGLTCVESFRPWSVRPSVVPCLGSVTTHPQTHNVAQLCSHQPPPVSQTLAQHHGVCSQAHYSKGLKAVGCLQCQKHRHSNKPGDATQSQHTNQQLSCMGHPNSLVGHYPGTGLLRAAQGLNSTHTAYKPALVYRPVLVTICCDTLSFSYVWIPTRSSTGNLPLYTLCLQG